MEELQKSAAVLMLVGVGVLAGACDGPRRTSFIGTSVVIGASSNNEPLRRVVGVLTC